MHSKEETNCSMGMRVYIEIPSLIMRVGSVMMVEVEDEGWRVYEGTEDDDGEGDDNTVTSLLFIGIG